MKLFKAAVQITMGIFVGYIAVMMSIAILFGVFI
jgi:hypothetical protein